jgi:hypothetical protein
MKPLVLMMTNDTGITPVHFIRGLVLNLLYVVNAQINGIISQQTTACLYQELITLFQANVRIFVIKNPKLLHYS